MDVFSVRSDVLSAIKIHFYIVRDALPLGIEASDADDNVQVRNLFPNRG